MTNLNTSDQIEFDDIQGLVRFAHGHLEDSAFVLLRILDDDAARRWLGKAEITTAARQSPIPDMALQVAFTAGGLHQLGLDDALIAEFSDEFLDGMSGDENRSRRLGDAGGNDPSRWHWGSEPNTSPDLLLMYYAPEGTIKQVVEAGRDEDFFAAFEVQQTLISSSQGPEEPFGFADGISQPKIDWDRSLSSDPHDRTAYTNKMAIGEVLLGYENEYGLYTTRPLPSRSQTKSEAPLLVARDDPERFDLGRNGSYLVMRQLAQNVPQFWQYLDGQAAGNAQTRYQLAAAMVGRQRSGAPLIDGDSSEAENNFTFDSDPLGQQCPMGSHIRRMNPRTGDFPPGTSTKLSKIIRTLGFGRQYPGEDLVAASRFHRVLRRGRVYGEPLSPEEAIVGATQETQYEDRGLYFICLGANIARQFEFVQGAWAMSSKFAGLPTESDPLLGNRQPLFNGDDTDRFTQPKENAPAECMKNLPQFVTVRGGAYFFMPGMRALKYILHDG